MRGAIDSQRRRKHQQHPVGHNHQNHAALKTYRCRTLCRLCLNTIQRFIKTVSCPFPSPFCNRHAPFRTTPPPPPSLAVADLFQRQRRPQREEFSSAHGATHLPASPPTSTSTPHEHIPLLLSAVTLRARFSLLAESPACRLHFPAFLSALPSSVPFSTALMMPTATV